MNIHLSEHFLEPSLTINPHHILIELSKGFVHSSVFSQNKWKQTEVKINLNFFDKVGLWLNFWLEAAPQTDRILINLFPFRAKSFPNQGLIVFTACDVTN